MNYKGVEIPNELLAIARAVLAKLESPTSTPELLQELREFLSKQIRVEIDSIDNHTGDI